MLTSAKRFQVNLDLTASLLTLPRSPLLRLLKLVLRRPLRPLRPPKLLRLLKLVLRRPLRPPKLLRLRLPRPLRRIIVYQLILLINVVRELPSVRKDTAAVNMVTVESLMTTVRVAVVANLNLVNASKLKNIQKLNQMRKVYTRQSFF